MIMVTPQTLESIERFAKTLSEEIAAQLKFYGLDQSYARLVFAAAWREAVARERLHHRGLYTLTMACVYGTWLYTCTEVAEITPRDIGQAELRHPALGLPIFNDVMLDVPNPN